MMKYLQRLGKSLMLPVQCLQLQLLWELDISLTLTS